MGSGFSLPSEDHHGVEVGGLPAATGLIHAGVGVGGETEGGDVGTGMGCRVGEALALAWEPVDLQTGVVRFEKKFRRERIDGEWRHIVQDPKTADLRPDKAGRTVRVARALAGVDQPSETAH